MSHKNIVIVDDHPLFRQGLRDVLETDDNLDVVDEAPNGEKAAELATSVKPDIMIMDINLPDTNGLQVTRQIKGPQRCL